MRAPLSIVIPTLNSEATLPDTLASLMEGVAAGIIREVVISDGGSTDQTLKIAEETGAEIARGEASRGGQLGTGAEASSGDWLLFVHSDTRLLDGWSDAVSDFMGSDERAGYGELTFVGGGFRASCVAKGANIRSRILGLPFGDQSLLIPRKLYDAVGGYPDIPLMEDVAIARNLKGKLSAAGFTVATRPTRYERDGYMRRVTGNAFLLLRYFLGARPEKLAKRYEASSTK